VETFTDPDSPFIPGKANLLKEGKDICIVATGLMVRKPWPRPGIWPGGA
jgi:transketolase